MTTYLPKTVMITAANSGFGVAFAKRFAAAGCRLILTARSQDKLNKVVQGLGVPVHGVVVDLSDRAAVEAMFAGLPADFRAIDLLINNAGGALGLEPGYAAQIDDWQKMVDVNILGLLYCTRLAIAGMVERKCGHIVNIGSVSGSYAYPGGSVYCASKAFVEQFSRTMRCDLIATQVRVTNIEPGMVETDFSLNRFKGDAERAAKIYAGANPLVADDVAETVFWAATLPPRVNINSIELMPVTQAAGPLAVHRTA
ncbi:MAG: SDR family NAD(P)-dependent oxidoreductase [Alphaproteobacteria bacterium]|nr:SDR family NAD(P)-dependent oxidoreductase [Alphaproteobacteria bacterium]MBV8548121.1 SDR family NAD(P)-dependent oxidoreductase [Alphaproteobacteria bacterium]